MSAPESSTHQSTGHGIPITAMTFAQLLHRGNIAGVETHLRQEMAHLAVGDRDAFIAGAVSDAGKRARAAYFADASFSQSPIHQEVESATRSAHLIENMEESISMLTAYAEASGEEKKRRDEERPHVAQQLGALWESHYLDRAYVEGLQDEFDNYYLTREEAESRKNHIEPRIVKGLDHFMQVIQFDGDTLLLGEDERRNFLGAPAHDGTPTIYGALAKELGPIQTPGIFQGKFMHSGQLELAIIGFANRLFTFIENGNNFPRGKTERELWQQLRGYVGANQDISNEEVLVKFQKRVQAAFEQKKEASATTIFLPIAPGAFAAALLEKARECEARIPELLAGRPLKRGVTIDRPETRVLEDALYVTRLPDGRFILEISIPDVPSVIGESSELLAEARLRREVDYVDGRRVPILPRHLTNKFLGLEAGSLHPAMTLVIGVSPKFDALLNIELTAVDIIQNLTYEEADLVQHFSSQTRMGEMLQNMVDLASRVAGERRRQGVHIPSIDRKDPAKVTERAIAEIMRLVNRVVGSEMAKEPSRPALYLQHVRNVDGHNYSRYTANPNEAINRSGYMRVTEPLLRAADVINAILLLHKFLGHEESMAREELQEICDYLNEPFDALPR